MENQSCPFCFSNNLAISVSTLDEYQRRVKCKDCGALGPNGGDSGSALLRWNNRARAHPESSSDLKIRKGDGPTTDEIDGEEGGYYGLRS